MTSKFNKDTDVVVAIRDGIVWDCYIPEAVQLTVVFDPEDEEGEAAWEEAMKFIEKANEKAVEEARQFITQEDENVKNT